MIIRLETKKTTEKAYLLAGGGWIPKSVLRTEGLKFPYFEIASWYLLSTKKQCSEGDTRAKDVLTSLDFLEVEVDELPPKVQKRWFNANKCNKPESSVAISTFLLTDVELY
jgi:hypothetical protein